MNLTAVAIDHDDRIAALEADNRAMGRAIMELTEMVDILLRPMVAQVEREARVKVPARKSLADSNECAKIEATAESAGNTLGGLNKRSERGRECL